MIILLLNLFIISVFSLQHRGKLAVPEGIPRSPAKDPIINHNAEKYNWNNEEPEQHKEHEQHREHEQPKVEQM